MFHKIDSARVGNLIDAHVKNENSKIEDSQRNAFRIKILSDVKQQPTLALHQFGIKDVTSTTIINEFDYDIPSNIVKWSGDTSKIDLKKYPYLDAALIEEIVATAVISQDRLENLSKRRNGSRLSKELSYGIGSSLPEYRNGKIEEWYNYDRKKGGWRPDPNQVLELSSKYNLDSTDVETAMISAITPYSHLTYGDGMLTSDFDAFQRGLLKWYHTTTIVSTGLDETTEDASNPLLTDIGRSNLFVMSKPQKSAIHQMTVDLEGIKDVYQNYKNMPLPQLRRIQQENSDKFKDGNRSKLQGAVWADVQANGFNNRVKNLIKNPVGTVLRDLGYMEHAINVNNSIPLQKGGKPPPYSLKVHDEVFDRMKEGGSK